MWEDEQLGDYPSVQINDFLEHCEAKPCTAHEYATWLSLFLENGGTVAYFHDSFGGYGWMKPTVSTRRAIPTAYGSGALRLVMVPSTGNIPLHPTSGDSREGWEWGHTQVFAIVNKNAYTNTPGRVPCYSDIESLLSKKARQICLHQKQVWEQKRMQRGMESADFHKRQRWESFEMEYAYRTPLLERACDMRGMTSRHRRHLLAPDATPRAADQVPELQAEAEKSPYELGAAVLNSIVLPVDWKMTMSPQEDGGFTWTGLEAPETVTGSFTYRVRRFTLPTAMTYVRDARLMLCIVIIAATIGLLTGLWM